MAQNTTPIFGLTPHASGLTTGVNANTALDGTGTVATIFTAGSNGSKVERISFTHLGTNIATVVRLFINNGSTNATASNNFLIHEETMAANTVSQVAASVPVVWYGNIILPSGYKINATIGTAIASGVMVVCEGTDY